jgi:electron transfer flavoprotein beta subunit
MNIAVVIRQVPDLIEPLEIASSGAALDLSSATFIINESDDHALEQAILLKEAGGATVTAVALDFGDVDNTLYTAAAKGADRIVKISRPASGCSGDPPAPRAAAALYAAAVKTLSPDLVLVGVQAHDELDGGLSPFLAAALGLPYVGVIRGVRRGAEPSTVSVCKEFPGAVMAEMNVQLPAVLGIVGAEQPPRYVPVAKIRAAMKSAQFEEQEAATPGATPPFAICRLEPPVCGSHAEMLSGSEDEVAARIAEILAQKGLVK